MRIGYFVPEFPGQTHIFFWRELQALRRLGVETVLLSTRPPDPRVVSHPWAAELKQQTKYLFPPRPRAVLAAVLEFVRAGPRGWGRCLSAIARAEGSLKDRLRLVPMLFMGSQLAAIARRRGFQHVHVQFCGSALTIALFASLLAGLRYSIGHHSTIDDYGPNQKVKWRNAAFAVVVARRLCEEAKETLGFLPDRLEIAPMGVELEKFQRQTPYQPWEGAGPCRIFCCGRLNANKGHTDLVQALALLRDRGLDAHLCIAGEDDSRTGEFRKQLEELIARLGLTERVRLLGAVAEDVVRGELERAHVFALASLMEALGVATMEAMAMQLPVVVTRVGGVPELVQDGVNGLLVSASNPGDLAAGLERVLRDPALARRLGEAGRRTIAISFHSGLSAEAIHRCLSTGDV